MAGTHFTCWPVQPCPHPDTTTRRYVTPPVYMLALRASLSQGKHKHTNTHTPTHSALLLIELFVNKQTKPSARTRDGEDDSRNDCTSLDKYVSTMSARGWTHTHAASVLRRMPEHPTKLTNRRCLSLSKKTAHARRFDLFENVFCQPPLSSSNALDSLSLRVRPWQPGQLKDMVPGLWRTWRSDCRLGRTSTSDGNSCLQPSASRHRRWRSKQPTRAGCAALFSRAASSLPHPTIYHSTSPPPSLLQPAQPSTRFQYSSRMRRPTGITGLLTESSSSSSPPKQGRVVSHARAYRAW